MCGADTRGLFVRESLVDLDAGETFDLLDGDQLFPLGIYYLLVNMVDVEEAGQDEGDTQPNSTPDH